MDYRDYSTTIRDMAGAILARSKNLRGLRDYAQEWTRYSGVSDVRIVRSEGAACS
jgi:hypothetical protein